MHCPLENSVFPLVRLLLPLQAKDFYSRLINCTFGAVSNNSISRVR